MGKRSEKTKQDKARLALLDKTERKNFAKELEITESELIELSTKVRPDGTVEHNKQKIRDYLQAQRDRQNPSILAEEIDPAPNGEVL